MSISKHCRSERKNITIKNIYSETGREGEVSRKDKMTGEGQDQEKLAFWEC